MKALTMLLLCFCPVAMAAAAEEERVVLFLGDSLTAGYGLQVSQAYPAFIQEKIEKRGWPVRVVNAGVSGDTSAGGLGRIDWLLRGRVDVLVLELGANDGLRGIQLESTEQNLQSIIDRTRSRYPEVKIVIAGMMVPANLGPDYTRRFRGIFPRLAERNGAALIPFLLEGVGGRAGLNQADGVHPTAEGNRIVADTVWRVLEPVLRELMGS